MRKIGDGLTANVFEAEHSNHGRVSIKIINNEFAKGKTGSKLIAN